MSGKFEEQDKSNDQTESDVNLMDFHLCLSPYEYEFMVSPTAVRRERCRCATTLAVSFAVSFATFAESLVATLRLWSTTLPANEGTARQPLRTTSTKGLFHNCSFLWCGSSAFFIDCELLQPTRCATPHTRLPLRL